MTKKINEKKFKTLGDLELIVKNRRSAVIFEVANNQDEKKYCFTFKFSPEVFKQLFTHLQETSNKSWANLNPRDADSFGADYAEYYDKKFDNNGYLGIKRNILSIDRPVLESNKLYQFNKRKMESFIYDFENILKGES